MSDDRIKKVQKIAGDIRRTATVLAIMRDALEEAAKARPQIVRIVIRVGNPQSRRLARRIAHQIFRTIPADNQS
jgi:hypothetical protein